MSNLLSLLSGISSAYFLCSCSPSIYDPAIVRAAANLSDLFSRLLVAAVGLGHADHIFSILPDHSGKRGFLDCSWHGAPPYPAFGQPQCLSVPGEVLKDCDKCLPWQVQHALASLGAEGTNSCAVH